ncbi:MAG: glycosyltransferase [Pseudomonadota bacterium]
MAADYPMSMSVLWLARTIPLPLTSGDRIYTAGLVQALGGAGADVKFLGLANPDEPMGDASVLSDRVTWVQVPGEPNTRVRSVLSTLPLVSARFATAPYRKALTEELEKRPPDVIVLDHYAMAWALPTVRRLSERPIIIHIAHNVETEVTRDIARDFRGDPARRAFLTWNAAKTARAEAALVRASDGFVTLTEYDSLTLAKHRPGIARLVSPPGYAQPKRAERVFSAQSPREVLILGSYHWIAKRMNLEHFLREASGVFEKAGIICRVAGSIPDDLRERCEAEYPSVVFEGYVEDVQETLDRARFGLVVETTGGGFKLKMLDYIFQRVPLAGIDDALRGLPDSVMAHVVSAPDAAKLAHAVADRIDDIEGLQEMQAQAFDAALDAFEWKTNGASLRDFVSALREKRDAA